MKTFQSTPRRCLRLAAVLAGLLSATLLPAQQPAHLQFTAGPTNLTLQASNDVALYYLVEQSTSLPGFLPWSMKLGNGGPTWSIAYDSGPAFAFFRGRWFSLYGPGDLDADGMDDVWELDHPDVLDGHLIFSPRKSGVAGCR